MRCTYAPFVLSLSKGREGMNLRAVRPEPVEGSRERNEPHAVRLELVEGSEEG